MMKNGFLFKTAIYSLILAHQGHIWHFYAKIIQKIWQYLT
jgi:hypothetical protein